MPMDAEDIVDLTNNTLRDLGRLRFTEIASDLQDFIAMNAIMRRERASFGSGFGFQWTVMVDTSGAARNVQLFEPDVVPLGDVTVQATVPWKHCQTAYGIERREISMNRSPARIVELLRIRRTDALISLAELMETNFWQNPVPDDNSPFGAFYWILSGDIDGFNTNNPTNFAAGAGNIDSSVYNRWGNWADFYVTVDIDDAVAKMRKGHTLTGFKNAVATPTFNTGDRYGIYAPYDEIAIFEKIIANQNENLGNDLASKDGRTMFRGTPVVWVPFLDADARAPIVGINWGVFSPVFLSGEYLRETGPQQKGDEHNTLHVFVDCTMNFICRDRRRNWIISLS